MMREDNLLLRVRAEALCANVLRLQKNLEVAPGYRKGLDDLESLLDGVLAQMNQARKRMLDIGSNATGALIADVDFVDQSLATAWKSLKQAKADIGGMRTKGFSVNTSPVAGNLTESLKTSTAPVLGEAETIAAESQQPEANLADLWRRLRAVMGETAAEIIFSDYVELIGGVALRDARFDEGISEFADDLLRSYVVSGAKPDFVAIPMREQALIKTFSQIIRVTFPDWTIWSLPSTALEFWKAVACHATQRALDAALATLPAPARDPIQSTDRDALGDGYATYTMGPAYAYFAVTLMLDPANEAHHTRVRVILAMLERMDAKVRAATTPPYKATRCQLLGAWNAARTQLGQSALALDPNEPARADDTDPAGAGARILIRTFAEVLERMTSAGFVVGVWNEIQPWVDALLDGDVSRIQIPVGAELRHVLNAAWIARTHPQRDLRRDLTKDVEALRELVRQKGTKDAG